MNTTDLALRAIAEPRRRAILRLMQKKERSAGEIAAHFRDVTRPAISQHLKVLTAAGLVSLRREGTRRFYRVRPEGMAELRAFLGEFWEESLIWLKEETEAEERRRKRYGAKSK